MPFILILFGAIFLDLGMRGTEHEFGKQLAEDLNGTHFWAWMAACAIVGVTGYYKPARPFSDALMALIIISLAISQRGLIPAVANILTNPPSPAPSVPLPQFTTSSSSGGGSGGASGASFGGGSSSGGDSTVAEVGTGLEIASALA